MKNLNLPLIAILILALAVRLISLADHSLWYDEAFSVLFAQNDLETMLSGTVNAVEHPLLYYISLNFWMRVLGESVFVIRLWSVVTGVVTVFVIYLITQQLFDKQTAQVSAFITAVAPFHLQYSQEARMYSLMALLLMLVTYCYVRGRKSTSWLWWIAFGVAAGLAMHTQQLAAFYLLAIGLVPLFQRNWRVFFRLSVGAILAVIIFLPWLINLPQQVAQLDANYWINQPPIFQPLISLGIFYGGFHEFSNPLPIYGGAIFLMLIVLFQVFMYSRKPRRKSRHQNQSDMPAVLLLLWLLFAPMAFMWLFSQAVPVYLERALIGSVMMLYILLGWFFTRSRMPKVISLGLGVIFSGIVVMGIWQQWRVDSFPYSPIDEVIATIRDNVEEDDVVIHMNKLTVLPAQVYAPDIPQRFITDIDGSANDTLDPSTQAVLGVRESQCVQQAAESAERIWFVTLQRAEEQYRQQGINDLDDAFAWLEASFSQGETQQFNDVNLYFYTDATDFEATCNP